MYILYIYILYIYYIYIYIIYISELVKKASLVKENKQQECLKSCFLTCKSMYILKMYSILYTSRCKYIKIHQNTKLKKFCSEKTSCTKYALFYPLHKICPFSKICYNSSQCGGYSVFHSVSFLLNFIFLFNKMHGLFDFKTS